MIYKDVERKAISYYSKCKNIMLMHLYFADNLLVFIDGTKRSKKRILTIFDGFAKILGLKNSFEKSTLYIAGTSEDHEADILT